MKKMKGIVDPISLTLALVLGIAAVGIANSPEADEQQIAQDAGAETTQVIENADS